MSTNLTFCEKSPSLKYTFSNNILLLRNITNIASKCKYKLSIINTMYYA